MTLASGDGDASNGRAHSRAWFLLCITLGIHVLDEALNGFLGFYNPAVAALRERFPFVPLPTFSFGAWLAGLVVAVGLLTALTPLASREVAAMTPLSYAFAVIMFANGLLHVLGSLYFGEWMPGVYSAPLLVVGSVYLVLRTPARVARSSRALPQRRQDAKQKTID